MLECMALHGIVNLVPPTPLPSTNYLILGQTLILEDDNHKGDC